MSVQWKNKMMVGGWLLLIVTGMILLVAAVQRKNSNTCSDIKVELSGSTNNFFIDEKEVLKLVNANGTLIGKKIDEINLEVLEKRLESDTWIANAELFFDKDEVLNINVEEREPVARVFTNGGNSFYLDSACKRLPVSERVTVRVPMFTSFPSEARRLRSKDSLLLSDVKTLASFISKDQFWNAQVAQVDITPDRTFEMIPTLGNHVVVLGRPEDYEEKFARLYTFYKQIWTKVGMEKYSRVDVQFSGQIVATRRGEGSGTVDSTRAKEAFDKLMKENKEAQQEEPAVVQAKPTSQRQPERNAPERTTNRATPAKPVATPPKPRAVMPARER